MRDRVGRRAPRKGSPGGRELTPEGRMPLAQAASAKPDRRMSAHSDAELAALLRGGKSHLAERKRSARDRSGIRRNICAFANDIAGAGRPGVIFVGVEDDGTCANIQVDDPLMRNLAQMGSHGNILPLPDMTVERKIFEGCEVAVVQVAPERRPPVRYRGKVWVKAGPTAQLASPEQERRLSERRRAANCRSTCARWKRRRSTRWIWIMREIVTCRPPSRPTCWKATGDPWTNNCARCA